MKDVSDRPSILPDVRACIALTIAEIVGRTILDVVYWSTLPKTPYYLKKKIKHLEYQLITETCKANETIIIP